MQEDASDVVRDVHLPGDRYEDAIEQVRAIEDALKARLVTASAFVEVSDHTEIKKIWWSDHKSGEFKIGVTYKRGAAYLPDEKKPTSIYQAIDEAPAEYLTFVIANGWMDKLINLILHRAKLLSEELDESMIKLSGLIRSMDSVTGSRIADRLSDEGGE